MPNLLIRDVPSDDLEEIRAAAADLGVSMQAYLRDSLHVQAAHQRRRAAVNRVAKRLEARRAVTNAERLKVLDSIDEAHEERAAQLGDQASS